MDQYICMRKKIFRNPNFIRKRFLVTQEELAGYLGVKLSMYAMAEKNERELPATVSKKLTDLEILCLQVEQEAKAGKTREVLQTKLDEQATAMAEKLLIEAEYHNCKAKILQDSFIKMIHEQTEQKLWLDIIDHKLESLNKVGDRGKDLSWFSNLHSIVSNRIIENAAAQVKLQIKIDLVKATAESHERHHLKLNSSISAQQKDV